MYSFINIKRTPTLIQFKVKKQETLQFICRSETKTQKAKIKNYYY